MLELYTTTDPLTSALALALALGVLCWLLSLLTREYSWVDRLWSLTPPLFALHFAGHAGFADVRLNVMAGLAVAWGARLTWNFARKGGYAPGGEDYRWAEVQRRLGPVGFQVLNATFIGPLQNLLLLGLAVPAYYAGGAPLGATDAVALALFLLFLLGETVADEQQWRFQKSKKAAREAGLPHPPFLTRGLFRYSRHPHYFCEQALWWSFYLFSVASAGWLHPGILGPLCLTLLFQGSTALTEQISLKRYPSYAAYQRTTSRLLPWFPGVGDEVGDRHSPPAEDARPA